MAFKVLILAFALCVFSVATGTKTNKVTTFPRPSRACFKAFRECQFRFAGPFVLRSFSIHGRADVAFTPRIISKRPHELLGVLNSNNIVPEFIKPNGVAVPITKVTAKQSFTPTHFKPYTIKRTPFSGIGHQTFHQDQKQIAKHQCVRVWFTHYQILKTAYPLVVKENRNNVPRYEKKCVVFFTK